MSDANPQIPAEALFKIGSVAEATTFVLVIGFIYGILRSYLYYNILLHVPIFQYLDVTEILLSFPTVFYLTMYALPMFIAVYITRSNTIPNREKLFYAVALIAFALIIIRITGNNDPIIAAYYTLPHKYKYFYYPPLLWFVYVVFMGARKNDSFFKNNFLIGIIMFSVWYGGFESFANYQILLGEGTHLNYRLKFKDGKLLHTDKKTLYAGRTKNYWFFYDKQTKYVRAIKNDDVVTVDFDTELK